MTINSLENVGIVVQDLPAVTSFFADLGMTVEGEATVEGDWVDRVLGMDGVRSQIAVLRTPDGHGRLELMHYLSPESEAVDGGADVPLNALGIRRLAFSVDDIDTTVAGLRARGLELMGEVVRYEDVYRLCYVRGPEGIVVMLAEQLG